MSEEGNNQFCKVTRLFCVFPSDKHSRQYILAHQIEYSTFFTHFNKAYLVNLYAIKLVDPWVR